MTWPSVMVRCRSAAAAMVGSWVMTTMVRPVWWSWSSRSRIWRGRCGVEVASGFVAQHERWVPYEGAGDCDALFLAAGQGGAAGVASVAEADLVGGGSGASASFSRGGALVEEPERDVVDDSPVADEVERLEHEPDAPRSERGAGRVVEIGHVDAVEQVAAGGGCVQQPEQRQQGGLARTGCASDRDVLPGADREPARVERGDGGWTGEGLGEPVDHDHIA